MPKQREDRTRYILPPDPPGTEWRDHPRLSGWRVSSTGRVQRWRPLCACRVRELGIPGGYWREVKVQRLPTGYRCIHITRCRPDHTKYKEIHYVHAMVAECFIGPRPDGMEVCHDNGVNHDNRVENLKYGTKFDNAADSARHGTRPFGSRHGIAKLNEEQVAEIHRLLRDAWPMARIAKRFGVCPATVENIRHRRTWRHVSPPSGLSPEQPSVHQH